MITWLENPVRYAYLRRTPYMSLSSRFPAKTIGRRLRSEAIYNGRTAKGGNPQFLRPGLKKLIEKEGEKPGQSAPSEWPAKAVLPERWGPDAWK